MFNYLRKSVIDNEKRLEQLNEELSKHGARQGCDPGQIDHQLHFNSEFISSKVKTFINKTNELIDDFETNHDQNIETNIHQWKYNQKILLGGENLQDDLDHLQESCEKQALLLLRLLNQVKILIKLVKQLNIISGQVKVSMEFQERLTNLMKKLISCSFVIEKQPEQIIRSYSALGMSVRLLVGHSLNLQIYRPVVKVSLIKEKQAKKIATNNLTSSKLGRHLISCTMDFRLNRLVAEIDGMKVKMMERGDPDRKLALLVQTEVKVLGESISVFDISLPIVMIAHHSQEPNAMAAIVWDNHFSQSSRLPFEVPDEAPIHDLVILLSRMFEAYVGRGLNEDQCMFLARKALRCNSSVELANQTISWSQFAQEPIPERTYTFWEWFYEVLKMCQDYLKNMWNEGLITAFVGRKHCLNLLQQRPQGTFMIKVSEFIKPGAITIVWVGREQRGCRIYSLKTYNMDDMKFRKLPELLRNLDYLTHFYPDIPKDQAFGKYYENQEEPRYDQADDYHLVDMDYSDICEPRKEIEDKCDDGDIVQALSKLSFKNTFDEIDTKSVRKSENKINEKPKDYLAHLFDLAF